MTVNELVKLLSKFDGNEEVTIKLEYGWGELKEGEIVDIGYNNDDVLGIYCDEIEETDE